MKRFAGLLIVASALACSSASKDNADKKDEGFKTGKADAAPEASVEAKQIAAEQQAPYVSEITFKKGDAKLSREAQGRLNKLAADAMKTGKVEEIKVVSWADMEYPSVHTKQLPEDEVNLANHRFNSIKKYLEPKTKRIDITEYNMAERPNTIQRLFSSPDARLKKALEVSGIPNTDTSVKAPSKVAKAIVMVILKE